MTSEVADSFCYTIEDCFKLCVFISISVVYANMPYCIAKYCHVSYENNSSKAHFHRLPKRCALRRQWLAKSRYTLPVYTGRRAVLAASENEDVIDVIYNVIAIFFRGRAHII